MGIEPTCSAWKADILPLNYTRIKKSEPEGIRTPDPRLRRPLLYPAELPIHVLTQDILCHNVFHLSTTFLKFFQKNFKAIFRGGSPPLKTAAFLQFMRLKCSAFQYSMIAPSTLPFSIVRMPKVGRPPPRGREMLPGLNIATCQLSSQKGIWV